MKRLLRCFLTIIFIALFVSGAISKLLEFMAWLFMLNYSGPSISIPGEIIVRVFTFGVSFGLVGVLFSVIGLFNGRLMSILYFAISTVIGFVLACIVRTLEENLLIVAIILGTVMLAIIVFLVAMKLLTKRKKKRNNR